MYCGQDCLAELTVCHSCSQKTHKNFGLHHMKQFARRESSVSPVSVASHEQKGTVVRLLAGLDIEVMSTAGCKQLIRHLH